MFGKIRNATRNARHATQNETQNTRHARNASRNERNLEMDTNLADLLITDYFHKVGIPTQNDFVKIAAKKIETWNENDMETAESYNMSPRMYRTMELVQEMLMYWKMARKEFPDDSETETLERTLIKTAVLHDDMAVLDNRSGNLAISTLEMVSLEISSFEEELELEREAEIKRNAEKNLKLTVHKMNKGFSF